MSSSSNTAKETPIVSAISDGVEVTLPNKQMKDRESPAKGRKQKEQQAREHKDSVKDTPIREKVSDKESSNKSDNKSKESLLPNANIAATVTPVTVTNKDNKEVVTHRDDKKNQKKDVKNDTNVPVEVNESANVSTNQPAQHAQDVSSSSGKIFLLVYNHGEDKLMFKILIFLFF